MCWLFAFLRKAKKPIKPEPNNQTAAGSGTAETLMLSKIAPRLSPPKFSNDNLSPSTKSTRKLYVVHPAFEFKLTAFNSAPAPNITVTVSNAPLRWLPDKSKLTLYLPAAKPSFDVTTPASPVEP